MMEASFEEAAAFKKILDALKDVLVDVVLKCSESGISVHALDDSRVALVTMLLKSSGFKSYTCEKKVSMGIHLPSLMKIMKCVGNDDKLKITARDDDNLIRFVVDGKKGQSSFEYGLHQINIEQDELLIQDYSNASKLNMASTELSRIIKGLSNYGDTVKITCKPNGIMLTSKGDIGIGTARISKEESHVKLEVADHLSLEYATKYLVLFSKAACVGKTVTMALSDELPLSLEYQIEQKDCDNAGYVRYFIAPKVPDV